MRAFGFILEAAADARVAAKLVWRTPTLVLCSRTIVRLASLSPKLAIVAMHTEQHYLLYLKYGSEASRAGARKGYETILENLRAASFDLHPTQLAAAREDIEMRVRFLEAGWEGADDFAKGVLRDPEQFAKMLRKVGRLEEEDLVAMSACVKSIFCAAMHVGDDKTMRAVQWYLKTVPLENMRAWLPVYRKLAAFRKAMGKDPRGVRAFLAQFRGEASALKGLLQEQWFWQSQAWRQRQKQLLRQARSQARALSSPAGRQWRAIVITEPMRQGGAEIYDGAILLVAASDTPGHYNAIPFALMQVKAERTVTALEQIGSDRLREVASGGMQILSSFDGKQTYRMIPPPGRGPIRIVCASEVPAEGLAQLAPGIEVQQEISMLDAGQLDRIAYKLLEYFLIR